MVEDTPLLIWMLVEVLDIEREEHLDDIEQHRNYSLVYSYGLWLALFLWWIYRYDSVCYEVWS